MARDGKGLLRFVFKGFDGAANVQFKGYHPRVDLKANLKSISHRCYLFEAAFVWELTQESIHLPLGCLQGSKGTVNVDGVGWEGAVKVRFEGLEGAANVRFKRYEGTNLTQSFN